MESVPWLRFEPTTLVLLGGSCCYRDAMSNLLDYNTQAVMEGGTALGVNWVYCSANKEQVVRMREARMNSSVSSSLRFNHRLEGDRR